MSGAGEIKSRLTMTDLFCRYGFTPDRRGFIQCPFHSEKTASLGVYENGRRWKCFGCGAGGDVISFAQRLFGLSFAQAMTRLECDFGLDAPGPARGQEAARRGAEALAARRRALEAYRLEWTCRLWRYRMYEDEMERQKPRPGDPAMRPGYLAAARGADQEWEWLQDHPWR